LSLPRTSTTTTNLVVIPRPFLGRRSALIETWPSVRGNKKHPGYQRPRCHCVSSSISFSIGYSNSLLYWFMIRKLNKKKGERTGLLCLYKWKATKFHGGKRPGLTNDYNVFSKSITCSDCNKVVIVRPGKLGTVSSYTLQVEADLFFNFTPVWSFKPPILIKLFEPLQCFTSSHVCDDRYY